MPPTLITEADVRRAAACGGVIRVEPGVVMTPGAQDAALKLGVRVEESSMARPGAPPRRAVAIGADHGGFAAKEDLRGHLESLGFVVLDVGTHSPDPCDYPDIAERVARAVAEGRASEGIVIDGAGIGSAIAANKVRGIRAAKCDSLFDVRNSREHNHANVLSLGARIERGAMREMVRVWLDTPFGGDRHARRVAKIQALERRGLALLAVLLLVACEDRGRPFDPEGPRRVDLTAGQLASRLPSPERFGQTWRRNEPAPIDPAALAALNDPDLRCGALAEYFPTSSPTPLGVRLYLLESEGDAREFLDDLILHAQLEEGEAVHRAPPLGTFAYQGRTAADRTWRLYLRRGPFAVEILIPEDVLVEPAMNLLRRIDDMLAADWPLREET